jgi:hypothetical protein
LHQLQVVARKSAVNKGIQRAQPNFRHVSQRALTLHAKMGPAHSRTAAASGVAKK